jgi:hypothetical protein
VGVAQYLRPALGTSVTIADTAATKAVAFHDAAVGCAALIVGLALGITGVMRSRRLAAEDAREFYPPEQPARVSTEAMSDHVIELDPKPGLEPMPATPASDLAPAARRIWHCRLSVDLQQQRIAKEAIGAESKIDAELYVLSLRNLVHAVKEAQVQTRSLGIWEAMTTFGRAAGDPEEFIAALDKIDLTHGEPVEIDYNPTGTMIRIGRFELPAARLTAAADQLANATVGDLSDIRARSVQNSHVSARTKA